MNIDIRKNNKGITLIALVITIIVLLILAGVSIAMLTGQNGILTKAGEAKTITDKENVREELQMEAVGCFNTKTGEFDITQFGKNIVGIDEGAISIKEENRYKGYKYKVLSNGKIWMEGDEEETSGGDIIQAGQKAEGGNKKYTDETSTAVIPEGFTVSNIEDETKIKSGLVVTAPDGSQFVWVPVATAVSDTEANGTTNKALAIKQGVNYRGLLYKFTSTGSTVVSGCTTTSNGLREPAFLELYDNDNTILTQDTLQTEYNAIIESISKNGGFYVGRYETSWDSTNRRVQSKSGETSANASDTNTYMWYGLYDKQKTYAKDAELTVKSAMMYGSTYDAMLHWMQVNNIAVTVGSESKNTEDITGKVSTDKLNNIYDLLGNRWEWTTEAFDNEEPNERVLRGGDYNSSYSPAERILERNPSDTYSCDGSRLLLYL